MADDLVEQKANELLELTRTDPNCVSNVYICFANGCTLLTAYMLESGGPGWASRLIDDDGTPLLTAEEQEALESTLAQTPWLLEFLKSGPDSEEILQEGGGPRIPDFKQGSFVKKLPGSELTGADVSLDRMFNTLMKKTDEMDSLFADIALDSPGFMKLIHDHPGIPIPGSPVLIPLPPILLLVTFIIDSIRLSGGLAGEKNTALTILIMLEELVTGQWRHFILSALGLFSPQGVALGVMLKFVVNAWLLINPEIRRDLSKDMYRASKSLLIGFLLWAAVTFPPSLTKAPIKMMLTRFQQVVGNIQEQKEKAEQLASAGIAASGKRIEFKGLDLSKAEKLSLYDVQNFQTLAQWDLLVCTQDFQDIVSKMSGNPVLRLVVELLNIPTTEEDTYKLCKQGPPFPTLDEKIKMAAEPVVMSVATQKGGSKKRKMTMRKQKSVLEKRRITRGKV